MRLLLVNPPRSPHNAILDHAPAEASPFIHRRLIGPPLGLLTLAAALGAEHDVELLDMKGEYDLDPAAPAPVELVRRRMAGTSPRMVGVTVIASEHPAAMEILRGAKEADPGVFTVAGGLHATLSPGDFDLPGTVDAVIPGPAVPTLRLLAATVERGGDPAHVPGLLIPTGSGLVGTGPAPPWDPAGADFIMPDRSLVAPWLTTYVVPGTPGPSTYLFTSIGCAHRCSFCSIWPQAGGRYLRRRVESIVEELGTLDDYPVVRFADADTLGDPEFIGRLFDRIEAEGIRKEFIMDIRADDAARRPELIARLARGGLRVVISGFESFRPEELEAYGKGYRAEVIARAVEVFHDNGVLLRGNWLVRPEWGEADFDALEEFAGRHPVAFAGYTILTPMPGTPLHRELDPEIVDRDLARYNFFNCVLRTRLPLERFYQRCGALWRIRLGRRSI
jgi:radical SAM superfamily enzyme YgiQ (UPF0313 family)